MSTWRVTYGAPFPGWRDFDDLDRALEFAETAHAENPTITTTPTTLRQLLDSTEEEQA